MKKNYYTQKDKLPYNVGEKVLGLKSLFELGFKIPEFYLFEINSFNKIHDLLNSWQAENVFDKNSLWAVRSCANVEDGDEKSYAGLFESVLNCKTNDLQKAFEKVYSSYSKIEKLKQYNEEQIEITGCVILQKMVLSEVSGVGFSINPMNKDKKTPLYNIIPGIGSTLVSGEENALMLEIHSKYEIKCLTDDKIYKGKTYNNNELLNTSLSKKELLQAITPHLKLLKDGMEKLKKYYRKHIDVEFSISNNELYWLQLRGVTNLHSDLKYNIWDNSNISVNYSGIILPITSSFVIKGYTNVYGKLLSFLGANKNFFKTNENQIKNLVGVINGGLYYNITAWQQILSQLPFGKTTVNLLTKNLGAEITDFDKSSFKTPLFSRLKFAFNFIKGALFYRFYKKRYLKTIDNALLYFNSINLKNKTPDELIQLYFYMEEKLTRFWFPPMLNGFYTMLSVGVMQNKITKSSLGRKYPNLLIDAFSSSKQKVISVEIVRSLQSLLDNLTKSEEIRKIFANENESKILDYLERNNNRLYNQILIHIEKYGERCETGELKLETTNYKEDIKSFVLFLKRSLKTHKTHNNRQSGINYKKLIRQHYPYHFFKRWLFYIGISYSINRVRDKENFRFIRTKSFHSIRQILKQIDECLKNENIIDEKEDSFYLTIDEVLNSTIKTNYADIIKSRKIEYERYKGSILIERYQEKDNIFTPIVKESNSFSFDLKGIGCSSGIVCGEVVIVHASNIETINPNGKILVSLYFEPGWIGMFSSALGLISEKGSLLSHTSILCRELNLPFIVGVKQCLNKLATGDKIIMDGNNGSINFE